MSRPILSLLVVGVALLLLVGCSDDPAPTPEPTSMPTHETLFDPKDRRNGTRVGELDLSDQVIKLLWLSDGTPRVEIETSTRLTNKVVEIIAQDGTVSHEFYSADSTKTGRLLSWPAEEQPWSAGDKLMVRIREPRGRPSNSRSTRAVDLQSRGRTSTGSESGWGMETGRTGLPLRERAISSHRQRI